MSTPRGAIAGAVRLLAALTAAVGALDLAGLSWRRLRAFGRGAGCLADCRSGHAYGPWCQLGFPLPGRGYLRHALAEAAFPLPEPPQPPSAEARALLRDALAQLAVDTATEMALHGEVWLDGQGNRVDPPVDTVHLLHAPSCAILPDAEGKSGPCDCPARCTCPPSSNLGEGEHHVGCAIHNTPARPAGCQAAECFGIECMTECGSSHRLERYAHEMAAEQQRLTGPQRVRAKLREQGLAMTGGDSEAWTLPETWRKRLEPWTAEVARRTHEQRCGLCGDPASTELATWGQEPRPYFGASSGGVPLHHDGRHWVRPTPGGQVASCFEGWTIYGLRPGVGDWEVADRG